MSMIPDNHVCGDCSGYHSLPLVGGRTAQLSSLCTCPPPPPRVPQDLRRYHGVYHPGEVNRCPGCGRCQWIVGRATAECAFCATALPLAEVS